MFNYLKTSLAAQVIVAAFLGVFAGFFLGQHTKIFEYVGYAYSLLLQSVVFPYIISSLIATIGCLTPQWSNRLFKSFGKSYLIMMLATAIVVCLLTSVIPHGMDTIYLDSVQKNDIFKVFIDTVVPSNITAALAKDLIPAVVIFSVLFGLMIQKVQEKKAAIDLLLLISQGCINFWNYLIRFAPIATFALFARLAGTIRIEQFEQLLFYLIIYYMSVLIIGLWILPRLFACFTSSDKAVLLSKPLTDGIVVALTTTLTATAIPYIQKAISDFVASHKESVISKEDEQRIAEANSAINSLSYVFGHAGNYLIYLFVMFIAFYFDRHLSAGQSYLLPIICIPSAFGSPLATFSSISFLSSWLGFPGQTITIYSMLYTLIRYGSAFVSVVSISFVGLLTALFYLEKVQFSLKEFSKFLLGSVVVLTVAYGLLTWSETRVLKTSQGNLMALTLSLVEKGDVKVIPAEKNADIAKSEKNSGRDALSNIISRGVLRVGYALPSQPYAYKNQAGELVGFDIAQAYLLAKNLHVKLQFVPFTFNDLVTDLENGYFDIAMSGIYITNERMEQLTMSDSYLQTQSVFIAPHKMVHQEINALKEDSLGSLRIGIMDTPGLRSNLTSYFNQNEVVYFSDMRDLAGLFNSGKIDLAAWSRIRAQDWVHQNPGYYILVPSQLEFPEYSIAFAMAPGSYRLANYVNNMLKVEKNSGYFDKEVDKWIYLMPTEDGKPRWSVIDNVLFRNK